GSSADGGSRKTGPSSPSSKSMAVRVPARFPDRIAAGTCLPYHDAVRRLPPAEGDDWFGLSDEALPVETALAWAERPWCGAVVLFSGVVRDHADGRSGVRELEYEAYEEEVATRMSAIAAEVRARWPEVGRIAMLHRVRRLAGAAGPGPGRSASRAKAARWLETSPSISVRRTPSFTRKPGASS